jgi:hypothetical protein
MLVGCNLRAKEIYFQMFVTRRRRRIFRIGKLRLFRTNGMGLKTDSGLASGLNSEIE